MPDILTKNFVLTAVCVPVIGLFSYLCSLCVCLIIDPTALSWKLGLNSPGSIAGDRIEMVELVQAMMVAGGMFIGVLVAQIVFVVAHRGGTQREDTGTSERD